MHLRCSQFQNNKFLRRPLRYTWSDTPCSNGRWWEVVKYEISWREQNFHTSFRTGFRQIKSFCSPLWATPFLHQLETRPDQVRKVRVLQTLVNLSASPWHSSPTQKSSPQQDSWGRREITEPFVCRLRKPEMNIINVLKLLNVLQSFVEIFS